MENMIFDAEIVCYKLNMPVNTEKKSETILLNISPSVYNLVAQIAETEDRKLGYVARELMMRGLSRYELDGKLRDEASPGIRTAEVTLAPVVATITPPTSSGKPELKQRPAWTHLTDGVQGEAKPSGSTFASGDNKDLTTMAGRV